MASRKRLDRYDAKRDPSATPEPFGNDAAAGDATGDGELGRAAVYVVHQHAATRMHYDLRLEHGGVLLSFAVPKGPSYEPSDKHLAVLTEEHPLEYVDFEAVIPKGEYGGGPMICWDRGAVRIGEGGAEEGLARGKLDLHFAGLKLKGRFALVRLKSSAKDWLLFKKDDAFARAHAGAPLVEAKPTSVLSGLRVDELEGAGARAEELEAEARAAASGARPAAKRAAKAAAPRVVHEIGFGGPRVTVERRGEAVTVVAAAGKRKGTALEALFPELVRAVRALPPAQLVLEGELVHFDVNGRADVAALGARLAAEPTGLAWAETPATLLVTDVLELAAAADAEPVDVRPAPHRARRALAQRLVPAPGYLRAEPPLDAPLDALATFAGAHGLPYVVAHDDDAPYEEAAARAAFARPAWTNPEAKPPPDALARLPAARARHVTVTNRDKVFFPKAKGGPITKGELCDWLEAMAPRILPYLRDRPVVLVRYPDGVEGKSFYQWNVPAQMPAWMRTIELRDDDHEKGRKRGFLVEDRASLLYLGQLGVIPVHVLACRQHTLEHADWVTFDFDVKQASLGAAVPAVRTLHEVLGEVGLASFLKTSGQSGLHVLVPLGPGASWETAQLLAELVGRVVVARHAKDVTMERRIEKRGEKVYLDTGQTGPSRSIVGPFSVRATDGATVSTPLAWDELGPKLDPAKFTLRTVGPDRPDPMATMLDERPDLARVLERLAGVVGR